MTPERMKALLVLAGIDPDTGLPTRPLTPSPAYLAAKARVIEAALRLGGVS